MSSAQPSCASRRTRIRQLASRALVAAFVLWHLTFLLVRNIAGLAEEEVAEWAEDQGLQSIYDPLNEWTRRYEVLMGIDQGWIMFTDPLARSVPFPAVQIEFDDGTDELVLSDNEPEDVLLFFRFGGARHRKFEHKLATDDEAWDIEEMRESYQLPLWEQYVRWRLSVWRSRHPHDPRRPVRLVMLRRRFSFPYPDEEPTHYVPPETSVIAEFDAEGYLLP